MFALLQDRLFTFLHGNRLIYNTCWEDPRIDRQLLSLSADSAIVAITSAGCNVLDYLLDGPRLIHAVDVNFRQNALLALKIALFKAGDYQDLFALFGHGQSPHYKAIYDSLRAYLPIWARQFWDKKISYFRPNGLRPSFYWRGAAGDFAWALRHLWLAGKKRLIMALLEANSLEEQKRFFEMLAPHLFRPCMIYLLRRPEVLAFIGVPRTQIMLIEQQYPGGLASFVQDKVRQVFTTLSVRDNYFWRVYLTGAYTHDCCPAYLLPENFSYLRQHIDRIKIHTSTVTEFLENNTEVYSHFVLLDHLDWLAYHDNDSLMAEWHQIFRHSRPGTKILFRSASPDASFLPEEVRTRLRFAPQKSRPLLYCDRVGTYGSLHLAEVR